MDRNTALSGAYFGDATGWRRVALVLGASALIALAAQVSIRLGPVPMTLQTLAILLVGFALGARLAVATMLVYLAEGAMGLPVFANGAAGLLYMSGPTGGFLLGFVLMAWIAGKTADLGLSRNVLWAGLAAMLASAVIYLPGLAWPAAAMGVAWEQLWSGWMAPFLIGDALKAVLAALVVSGALTALRRRS